jgi:tetratricopeptide (TPR) repeat protein
MRKRTKIIIGIVGVVVIAGAGATIAFWPAVSGFVSNVFNLGQANEDSDLDQGSSKNVVVDPEVVAEAEAAELEGDTEAAIAVYDEVLTKTDDEALKSQVFLKKALVYSNVNDIQASIAVAEQAHTSNQGSLAPVTLLALLYEDAGEFAKAAEYYRKAADLIGTDALVSTDREYYLENAVRLEAM